MYKKIFGFLAALISVLIIGFGVLIFVDLMDEDTPASSAGEDKQEENENEEVHEVSELSDKKFEENESEDLNPFGDAAAPSEMRDADFQEYIHKMSHQKVEANDKWGFYKITEERINWLSSALNKAELSHKDIYERILNKWAQGDFSTVDEDHNEMWSLQGGNVGKATGILSESEEEQYINSAD
ncbi:hypothetical protein GCM10010954_10620 [Halobacillus andaensis]|uniref:Uncharacterized protein n=1 Tax=Halobacillus andaensis TaxID=1176239 RepID=A0A917EVW7_HALAA|nr:DUF6241 domain-containing protein [Halobacillus andaensis]MBP2003853.1 hypothetical protein [Halobacillus andaensis]GGF13757.1 hypothetical protein GCM10010954_10620 [Halobacillus andaensis]